MTEPGAALDVQQLWAEVNRLLREGSVNRPLWDAAEAASPILVDGDLLVLGLSAADLRHASYLETEINRARLREILHARTGRQLDVKVIPGHEPADWERFRERQRAQEEKVEGAVRERAARKGVEGIWDAGGHEVGEAMTGTRARAYPTVKARLLPKVFPLIMATEEKARAEDPGAEEVHQRQLNRVLERVATYTDVPATIVALEYFRYVASHKRAGGG